MILKALWFVEQKSTTFGLSLGQRRYGRINLINNAGWYNVLGQLIGWGDLAKHDCTVISKFIADDELFIATYETCGINNKNIFHRDSLEIEKCCLIIAKDKIYSLLDIGFEKITRKKAEDLVEKFSAGN